MTDPLILMWWALSPELPSVVLFIASLALICVTAAIHEGRHPR